MIELFKLARFFEIKIGPAMANRGEVATEVIATVGIFVITAELEPLNGRVLKTALRAVRFRSANLIKEQAGHEVAVFTRLLFEALGLFV